DNIAKSYNGIDFVFRGISFKINNGDVFGIFGPNGSGKSTLLKILAKVIIPTEGKVQFFVNNVETSFEKQRVFQSFVAPYLTLFEEFKPLEHIEIYSKILGIEFERSKAVELLEKFGLTNSMDKHIKEFSSGMKQRMKYILAFLQNPIILFLDEPFTNLDENGIIILKQYLNDFIKDGRIIVVATNDKREAEMCNKHISLQKLSSNEPNFNSTI
ncbi:MAG: ABC transporter ATP-binding protein, partial [Ignavibacteria bacterium]|nr:ABC transporter ATP-binding protein [Ignavibacteria bacterium]